MISSKGVDFIKHFEGFSPIPYRCPAGYWTIGFGTVIRSPKHERITEAEAEEYLVSECVRIENSIMPYVKVQLEQHQLDAIISFCYNLGAHAFISSTLRQKLNRGEIEAAGDEFLRWVYAGGKVLAGLVRRRQAERSLFLNAIYL